MYAIGDVTFFVPAADAGRPVADYDGAVAAAGTGVYQQFFHHLLGRGVALAPGAYEAMFPSMAHGPDLLTAVAEQAGLALAEALDP